MFQRLALRTLAFNKVVGSTDYTAWSGDVQAAFTTDVRASIANVAAEKRAVTYLRQALHDLGWRFGSRETFIGQLKAAGFDLATLARPIAGDVVHVSHKDL